MFAAFVAHFGTVDILVANAGLQRDCAFSTMTMAQWQTVLGVNLTGQFLRAREAVKEFLRRGVVPEISRAAGKIICMSSVHQVIINAIAPGAIRTPINTCAWNMLEAYDKLMTLVPYSRVSEPEDIAQTAAWLASDHADYIVGTTIFTDGGMTFDPGFPSMGDRATAVSLPRSNIAIAFDALFAQPRRRQAPRRG